MDFAQHALRTTTVAIGLTITSLFAVTATAQTATDLQCNGCVDEGDIRTFAVTKSKIRKAFSWPLTARPLNRTA